MFLQTTDGTNLRSLLLISDAYACSIETMGLTPKWFLRFGPLYKVSYDSTSTQLLCLQ